MRQFLIFTRKEFMHIFRDRWTMIIILVLPILMIILFGFGINTEVKNAKYMVYDPSRDVATQGVVNKLSTSEYFTFCGYLNSQTEIEDIFKEGKIRMVVVFSERFYERMLHTGDAQIQLITDGTDPNTANVITNYATTLIAAYQQSLVSGQNAYYQIVPEVKFLYNPTMKGAYQIVPGVMGLILTLICAMMTSISIVREKEMGTMEVLLVSPMKPMQVILSKVVPYFCLAVINYTTILLLAVFALKVPIAGNLGLLTLVSMMLIFVSLAVGILISTMVEKQLVALLISGMALMLPNFMLSGMMFPIENMPVILQWIAQVLPAKWYIMAIKKIMIKGLGFSSIINEILVLSSMAILLLVLSLKNIKTRLE